MPLGNSREEAEIFDEVTHVAFCRAFRNAKASCYRVVFCRAELFRKRLPKCLLALHHDTTAATHDALLVRQQVRVDLHGVTDEAVGDGDGRSVVGVGANQRFVERTETRLLACPPKHREHHGQAEGDESESLDESIEIVAKESDMFIVER